MANDPVLEFENRLYQPSSFNKLLGIDVLFYSSHFLSDGVH